MNEPSLWLRYYGIRFHLMAVLSSFLTANVVTYILNQLGRYPDTGSIWIALVIVMIYYLFNLVLRHARLNQIIYFLLIRGVLLSLVILFFAR